MIKKKILSLLLVFAMVMGISPFGEMVAYSEEDLSKPAITRMVINMVKRLERTESGEPVYNENGSIRIVDEPTKIAIKGRHFDKLNIVGVSILNGGESLTVSSFKVVGSGTIEVGLGEGTSIGSGGVYNITINYKDSTGAIKQLPERGQNISVGDIVGLTELKEYALNLIDENSADGNLLLKGNNIGGAYLELKDSSTNTNGDKVQIPTSGAIDGYLPVSIKSGNVTGNIPGIKDILIHNGAGGVETEATSTVTFKSGIFVFPKEGELKITDISPTSGPKAGGTRVRITGTGLSANTRVEFGDESLGYRLARSPVYSNGVLTVTAPSQTNSGTKNIRINGKQAYIVQSDGSQRAAVFIYTETDNSMRIERIDPERGRNIGGETISINGRNFQMIASGSELGNTVIISNETSVEILGGNTMVFTKKLGGEIKPSTWPEGAKIRKREIKVYMGTADPVEFSPFSSGATSGGVIELNSMIDKVNGLQTLSVITPLFETIADKTVDVIVEAENTYFDSDGNKINIPLREVEEARGNFTFEVPKNPEIAKEGISVKEGPMILTGERDTEKENVVANITGSNFLINSRTVGVELKVETPEVFLVPQGGAFTDKYIKDNYKSEIMNPYRAELKDEAVYLEKGGKIVRADGVLDRVGTEMTVIFPNSKETSEGLRDLIVINPDGGYTRVQNAFQYKARAKDPEIVSLKPLKVDAQGGETMTLEGKNIIKSDVLVTVDGKQVKIISIKDKISGSNTTQEIVFEAPKGTVGSKIVQVINRDEEGFKLGMDSLYDELIYTRVTSNPKIEIVAPDRGSEGTKVIIKGSGFQKGSEDSEGTVVYFGSYKIEKDVDGASVEVIDTETINITMPRKQEGIITGLTLGLKDVTVENPDTARDTMKNAFNYKDSASNPDIDSITPDYGTVDGGTIIRIKGKDFDKTGDVDVYFGEKKAEDPVVNGDGTEIRVTTPKYDIPNGKNEFPVTVTVVNFDGGSVTSIDTNSANPKDDGKGFIYMNPGSFPDITSIADMETGLAVGTTTGNRKVVVIGKDFRYQKKALDDGTVPEDNGYEEGDILPKVYFGGVPAKKVEWASRSQLIVTTPFYSTPGKVVVTLVNPDAGTAYSEYKYEKSTPKIESIVPPSVTKDGGRKITVKGSGFIKGEYENLKDIAKGDMNLEAVFGSEKQSAIITGGRSTVEIGNVIVKYNSTDSANTQVITVAGFEQEKTYGRITEGEPLFMAIKTSGDAKIDEGVKVYLEGNNLVVERRAAIKVKWIDGGTLEITAPPMDGVGTRDLAIRNLDGGEAKTKVEVKNPASQPVITDIEPKLDVKGPNDITEYYSVESVLDGGITFTIKGADFRTGAKVFVGDQEAEVIARGPNDDSLTVRSPKGKAADIGKTLRIIVVNTDGGIADSSTGIGSPRAPGYYIYRESESSPKVTKIDPNKGSAIGGERVVITGEDFRPETGIEVKFGDRKAEVVRAESNYQKLVVLTPPSDTYGQVDVHIRNTGALGETIVANGYTYTSAPVIIKLEPDVVYSSGGEKVEIIGKGFQDGAKVSIDGAEVDTKFIDEFKLQIITPEVELPKGVDSVKKDVTVTNPDGGATTKKDGITFTRPFPMRPTGFKATPQHGRTMMLEWNKVNIIERYRVEISESENGPYRYLAEVSGGEYLARDLKPDTKYYFKLWALNEYGQSQGFATANNKTFTVSQDNQSGEFEDSTENKSEVVESGGNITINYAKNYSVEDYTHDFTDIKYSNYRTITLSIPASVVNANKGTLTLKHRDFELKSAVSMFKSPEKSYNSGDTLKVTITKLFDGEQATALRYAPAGYAAQKQGVKMEYTVGDGRNNTALKNINGIYLTTYVDKASLSELAHYSYAPGESSLQKEQSNFSKVYSNTHKKEIYKLDSYIKRSGYYIPLGR